MKVVVATAYDAAKRWKRQYQNADGSWKSFLDGRDSRLVFHALVSAGDNAKEVNRIIGNDSWTTIFCDVCSSRSPVVIELDEKFCACKSCIEKAASIFKNLD